MMINKEHYIVVLSKFWRTLCPVVACIEKNNGFNKTVQLPIQLTSLWNDWLSLCRSTDQQTSQSRIVTGFTRFQSTGFLSLGLFKRPCPPEQSTNNCRTQGSYHSADSWHNKRRVCQGNQQLCSTAPSIPSAPRCTFRTCLVKI